MEPLLPNKLLKEVFSDHLKEEKFRLSSKLAEGWQFSQVRQKIEMIPPFFYCKQDLGIKCSAWKRLSFDFVLERG